MVTDPISDLIVRLSNGSMAGKASVTVSYSKLNENIAHALKKAGYITHVDRKGTQIKDGLELGIALMSNGQARIHGVERVSKPSKRIYQKYNDIRVYRSGFGNVFLSTPKGIMVDVEAKKQKVGGEVLFKIW
jgi:small subunit ribosomal protein S8